MRRALLIINVLIIGLNSQAQSPILYGMTATGGANGIGVIFKFDVATNAYTDVYDFVNTTGSQSFGSLVEAPNLKLYGLNLTGGATLPGGGVLFEFDPATNSYTDKIDLHDSLGVNPNGDLKLAPNGKFYGMITGGGAYNNGVIFEYDYLNNIYTKKFDFDGANNGGIPVGSLTLLPDGKFVGLTSLGGTNNGGVIFEYDYLNNIFTKKADLSSASGINPRSTPTLSSTGKLYAAAPNGGSIGAGTVFEFDTISYNPVSIHDFDISDGSVPYGNITEGTNGKLYGMASSGSNNNKGMFYELDTSIFVFNSIVELDSSNFGAYPYGGLLNASNGKMYGLVNTGGSSAGGILFSFEYNPINIFSVLVDMDCVTGCNPYYTTLMEYYNNPAEVNKNAAIKPGINAFPNPFNDNATLMITSSKNENADIKIYNSIGEEIEHLNTETNQKVNIGEGFKAGIYFIKATTSSNEISYKLIKE